MMDKKSLMDALDDKKTKLSGLVTNSTELLEQIQNAKDLKDAEALDAKLSENKSNIDELNVDIADLTSKIEGIDNEMKNSKKATYIETKESLNDFSQLVTNSSTKQEFVQNWQAKLVENGVSVAGDTIVLPKMVDTGIQSSITENPVFGLFQKAPGGSLVYKKFDTTDKAVTRGTGYNVTETKTEQDSTLTVKVMPQNEIYKLTSVDYRALKTIGSALAPFLATELSQYVIDAIVELALYDGTGTDDKTKKGGFDAVVNSDYAVKVEYTTDLATAIRNNSFRANGAGAVTITTSGASNADSNTLVVSTADYAAIVESVNTLAYAVSDIPAHLGVSQIVVKDFTSAKYKPVILKKNAYVVSYDDFDKFDWYNIMNNTMKNEVVTLASGTLFEPNSAVVFTKKAGA